MSSLFYLTAIIFIIASPLIVPAVVTILHTVRDLRERAAAARAAFKPAFALAGAVPAAA
jgi:type IV secretory pathway VirB3-like protein